MADIIETVDSEVFAVWFLIGAALVFFMHGMVVVLVLV